MDDDITRNGSKFLPIVLFGLLSVFFAEGFSGSSPLWFIDPWGIFMVLPLYWGHALLLFNLAMKYKRTSMTQLYLWGVLFGLYESWMTKVLWAGYMEQSGPQFGSFLGFAVGEFMIIGLFWHTVFSFIVPILVFQMMVAPREDDGYGLSEHRTWLDKTRRNRFLFWTVFITGALFMPSGLAYDIFAVNLAIVGNLFLIGLFWWLTKRRYEEVSTQSLRIGKRGLTVTVVVLIALYFFMFLAILPERIASIETIALTIGFYLLVIALLYFSPQVTEDGVSTAQMGEQFTKRDLLLFLLVCVILANVMCFVSALAEVAATLFYLGMMFMGPILFVVAIVTVVKDRSSQGATMQDS